VLPFLFPHGEHDTFGYEPIMRVHPQRTAADIASNACVVASYLGFQHEGKSAI
jgi:hypothetical protein